MMKKVLAAALSAVLLCLPVLALGDASAKDETVYALLSAQGDTQKVIVVSHFDTPQAGTYTDYGTYASLAAMTTEAAPVVDGDTITWDLPADPEGFFAAGEVEAAQLPFLMTVAYTLDGAAVEPQDLAGQNGRVEMTLSVKPNPDAAEVFRTQYMAQIQVPLSLAYVSNIEAPGATSTLVGQTQTVTYTALPGQEAQYTVSFDAENFSFDGITVASMPMDLSGMLGADVTELAGQVGEMSTAAKELADGAAQLSEAVGSVADGASQLKTGADTLSTSGTQLQTGLSSLFTQLGEMPDQVSTLSTGADTLKTGVTDYVNGADAALSSVGSLTTALEDLAASGETMSASFEQVQQALTQVLATLPEAQRTQMEAEISALFTGMTQYVQGVSTVATGAGALSPAIEQLSQGKDALITGMGNLSTGIGALSDGVSGMGTNLETLETGVTGYIGGVNQTATGIGTLSDGLGEIAPQMQTLAEGQQTFAEGIESAIGALDGIELSADSDATLHSFVSENHEVRSVQFVLMTEAITPEAPERTVVEDTAPKTFWERLVALF